MGFGQIFRPLNGGGAKLSVTDVNQSVAIQQTKGSIVLTNLGTKVCFVRITDGTSVAVLDADYVVSPGMQVVLDVRHTDSHISCICASAETTDLHYIVGSGI